MTGEMRSATIALGLGAILITVGAAISSNSPELRILAIVLFIVGLLDFVAAIFVLIRLRSMRMKWTNWSRSLCYWHRSRRWRCRCRHLWRRSELLDERLLDVVLLRPIA